MGSKAQPRVPQCSPEATNLGHWVCHSMTSHHQQPQPKIQTVLPLLLSSAITVCSDAPPPEIPLGTPWSDPDSSAQAAGGTAVLPLRHGRSAAAGPHLTQGWPARDDHGGGAPGAGSHHVPLQSTWRGPACCALLLEAVGVGGYFHPGTM